jgi:Protein of unknown function (DUF4065)
VSEWTYDPRKFRELILFIAEKSADDGYFADTHMNKVLYWSDALAIQYLGKPITGARYQKLEGGPGAAALVPARRAMAEAKEVEVKKVHKKTVTRAKRKADPQMFTDDERKLVEAVIARIGGRPASVVSDEAHKLIPGWKMVEMKETVPLGAQMIDTAPVTATTRRRLGRFAEKYGL